MVHWTIFTQLPGCRIQDPGSEVRDPGSRFQSPESWTLDLLPPGTTQLITEIGTFKSLAPKISLKIFFCRLEFKYAQEAFDELGDYVGGGVTPGGDGDAKYSSSSSSSSSSKS